MVSRATKLAPMSEKKVQARILRGGFQQKTTHEWWDLKQATLFPQGIVVTAPKIQILIKIANARTTFLKEMKNASCVASLQSWIESGPIKYKRNTLNAVQLLTFSKSKKKSCTITATESKRMKNFMASTGQQRRFCAMKNTKTANPHF